MARATVRMRLFIAFPMEACRTPSRLPSAGRSINGGIESFAARTHHCRGGSMAIDIDRRTLIAAAAAFAVAPGAAQALGLPAGPDVLAAFSALPGITEGRGRGT